MVPKKSTSSVFTRTLSILSTKNIILLLSTFLLLNSCNDYTEKLSGGYFFRGEGNGGNDILGENEIQADVLSYNFNDDFIIASQKPKKFNDAIYDKQYKYKLGRNNIYYWIIVHKQKRLLGPLTIKEFEQERINYKIPEELQLKPVNQW